MSIAFYAVGILLIVFSAGVSYGVPDIVLQAIYSSALFVSGIGLIAAGAIVEAIRKSKD
ncbi:hypothetical protein PMI04_015060 [Sphingobium sp. AP49]|uniref:hypothetical protein n=1 Tax=Sphingobium sp. AP49 TaxID=1144307 RepID=UPI00026ED96C|nr:hypothetical protein [Sphingobium sp. AP49]WHO37879.1 hypothetical protein PMI04_015060 [Sphingobium sp. AP49]